MKTSAALVVLTFLGCASDPATVEGQADVEYRRVSARIQTGEEFERRKGMCTQSGGVFRVSRLSSGRMSPTTDELKTATCGKRSMK